MSAIEQNLKDILSGKEPTEEVADTSTAKVDATAGEEKAAPPAAGQEKVEGEKPAERTSEDGKSNPAEKQDEKPEPAKPRADVAAIIDERRKRQAAEKRLAEVEAAKPAAKPSVFDNEDEAISTRVAEGTRPLREQLYKLSMRAARAEHGETFAEAEQAFAEAAERDDRLIEGLRASDDPGEYVFAVGLQIKELADVGGNFVKYREKVTGELRGQLTERDTRIKALEAQIETLKKAQADLEALPRSLNSKSSGAAPKAGEEDEPDLRSITRFGNQQR